MYLYFLVGRFRPGALCFINQECSSIHFSRSSPEKIFFIDRCFWTVLLGSLLSRIWRGWPIVQQKTLPYSRLKVRDFVYENLWQHVCHIYHIWLFIFPFFVVFLFLCKIKPPTCHNIATGFLLLNIIGQ